MSEEKSHLGNRDPRSVRMSYHPGHPPRFTTIGSRTLDKGGVKGGNKYLQKCYLHIKCITANSLATLMWR